MSDNFQRSALELMLIAILIGVIHLAGIDRVMGSPMEYDAPSFKVECRGKLHLTDDSKGLQLDTKVMETRAYNHAALVCSESIVDKAHLEKIRAVCEIGDMCRIDGMIKPYSHDIYEWTRIDNVKRS